jgi:hypothetical protein
MANAAFPLTQPSPRGEGESIPALASVLARRDKLRRGMVERSWAGLVENYVFAFSTMCRTIASGSIFSPSAL